MFEAVRAEALFASKLQSSGSASPDDVRCAIATTLRRLGVHRLRSDHDPNTTNPETERSSR
jgi:hypothetical protein